MPENAFQYFQGRNNARVVRLLEQNYEVSAAIMGLLEEAVNYCNHKGIAFRELRIREGFVVPTDDGDASIRLVFSRYGG